MRSSQSPVPQLDFFAQFYEQYKNYLYKIAWDQYYHPQDIDDFIQTIWEKLLNKEERLKTLSHEQKLSYISTTVKNTIREETRKKTLPLCSLDQVTISTGGGINSVEERIDTVHMKQEFAKAWDQVSPDIQELLERKILLGESNEEIADAMLISPDSVRMYLTRAKRAAAVVLEPYRHLMF